MSTYTQCPQLARFRYVDKLKEPDQKSPALAHGTRVHALAAAWITKKLPDFNAWDGKELKQYEEELKRVIVAKVIPKELETFTEEFAVAIKAKAQCEEMWNFTNQWQVVEGSEWSPHIWLRVKVDAHWITGKTLCIRDHKTGRYNHEHAEQRSLYALAGLLYFPDVESCNVAHWYLDQGKEDPPTGETWAASEVLKLKREWQGRITAMMNDRNYAPRQSPKCKWCHFRKENGGPCEY